MMVSRHHPRGNGYWRTSESRNSRQQFRGDYFLFELKLYLKHPFFRFSLLVVFAVLVFKPLSWGSAFSIAELGARAAGMGTAFTSVADDGSALFYNPAGIGFQPGTRLQMDNLVVV